MVQIRLRSTGTAKLLGNQFPTFRDKFLALTSVTELSNNRAWNLDTPLRQFKSRKWLHKLHFLQVQKSLNNMHVWVRYIYIYILYYINIFFLWRCGPKRAMASSFLKFLDQIRLIRGGRTPLDEWSARRKRHLPHITQHSQQISMPPAGFEPAISADERL